MMLGFRGLMMAVAAVFAVSVAVPARADDCLGSSVTRVFAKQSAYRVEVRFGEKGWEQRFSPGNGADTVWWPLGGDVPEHAHLIVAIPPNSRRFAVIRAGAGRDVTRRVLVYEAVVSPRAPGPPGPEVVLIKAFDLADFMTAAELARVQPSISHLRWLDHAKSGANAVRVSGDDRLEMDVMGGRTVTLELDHLGPGTGPVKRP